MASQMTGDRKRQHRLLDDYNHKKTKTVTAIDMEYVERWTRAFANSLAPIRVHVKDLGWQVRDLQRKGMHMDRKKFVAKIHTLKDRISKEMPRDSAKLLNTLSRLIADIDDVDNAIQTSCKDLLFEINCSDATS